jgi:hypothetical protein
MRYSERLPVELLDVLVKYAKKLDEAEKKIYGADTFKGKSLLWAEVLPSGHYVLYGNVRENWFAEYYDGEGKYIKCRTHTQAFDFRSE